MAIIVARQDLAATPGHARPLLDHLPAVRRRRRLTRTRITIHANTAYSSRASSARVEVE
jgi:hypothetical protein